MSAITGYAVAGLAACSAVAPAPVDNRGAATTPPPSACPRLDYPWRGVAFSQCPSEPFETDLPVCAGSACPRPCHVTMPVDGRVVVADVRYDARGRWLVTEVPGATNRREATYEGNRLHSVRTVDEAGEYTETLYYDRGRLVRTWDGGDGGVHLTYDRDRIVGVAHPIETASITYDAAGRIAAVATEEHDFRYAYVAGVLTEIDDAKLGEQTRYTYDARGRLAQATSSVAGAPGPASVIEYDAAGRITRIGSTRYSYCD